MGRSSVYHLSFDNRVRFGSSEHYYHFLWGYLLPGLSEISRVKGDGQPSTDIEFHFRTCGPVMDKILHESAYLFNIKYKIFNRDYIDPAARIILVPRWDVEIVRLSRENQPSAGGGAQNLRSRRKASLLADINAVRSAFMTKVIDSQPASNLHEFRNKFIAIQRSAQPAYYNHGGMAEIPGYGLGRRTLFRLEETVLSLQAKDVPIALFEPGSVSLAEQIVAFADCKGVAGIFGAEFANIVWMPPSAIVIWIYNHGATQIPWVTQQLSQLLQLNFIPVKAKDDNTPTLPVDIFVKIQ